MTVRLTPDVEVGPMDTSISLVLTVVAGAPIDGIAWVTALDNGEHMEGSKHDASADTGWSVRAIDFDTGTTRQNVRLNTYLHDSLSDGYDILLEDKGGPNEHIHVEYDPA